MVDRGTNRRTLLMIALIIYPSTAVNLHEYKTGFDLMLLLRLVKSDCKFLLAAGLVLPFYTVVCRRQIAPNNNDAVHASKPPAQRIYIHNPPPPLSRDTNHTSDRRFAQSARKSRQSCMLNRTSIAALSEREGRASNRDNHIRPRPPPTQPSHGPTTQRWRWAIIALILGSLAERTRAKRSVQIGSIEIRCQRCHDDS